MSRFILDLSKDDLEGPLKDVIVRLQELAMEYGEDKQLSVDIDEDYNTFGKTFYVQVKLRGGR